MDKLKKFELMEKIARELEDVRKSQQAVLEKIGKIEVDNIELGDQNLEKILPDIFQRTADFFLHLLILWKFFPSIQISSIYPYYIYLVIN